jgi:hypothetical protein
MKNFLLLILLSLLAHEAWALRLTEYSPYQFEVLFTNPVCAQYRYERPVASLEGQPLLHKPRHVYCKHSDEAASVGRSTSPQFRLVQWISDPGTRSLQLAYLSFSNKNIVAALCEAAKRQVRIHIILDGGHGTNKDAEGLKTCRAGMVTVDYRGNEGGLGFSHNKFMLVNPGSTPARIVFSSGNMSSGTSINHENWNFVTTHASSYFAQIHRCTFEGMVAAGSTRGIFNSFMQNCRSKIQSPPESDIETFFIPTDAKDAQQRIADAITRSQSISIMAHRFSGMIMNLVKEVTGSKPIRLIMDDDVFWSEKMKQDIGRNQSFEAFRIYNELITQGVDTRFLQTNQSIFQLQHNKFMLFKFGRGSAVFTGAGNLTTAAFTKNFENFYYITIPEVVEAYQRQFEKYFNEMGTAERDMPREYVLP